MTFHGCRLPPDGAQRAASRISCTSASASGCGRNFRVEIRRLSASVTVNMGTPVLSAYVRTQTMNEIVVKLHHMRCNTAPRNAGPYRSALRKAMQKQHRWPGATRDIGDVSAIDIGVPAGETFEHGVSE